MLDCKILQERGGWAEDQLVNRCKFPIAPVNTYSNLAYVLAGLFIFKNLPNLAGFVQALAMVYLGVASALYHGTKRGWAAKLDHSGMYVGFTALTVYTLSPTSPFIGPVMALVATIVAWRLAYHSSWELLYPFMGVFVAICFLAVALNGSLVLAIGSLGTFGLAYIIWWADKRKTFWPKKWGHGLWHILTAAAFTMLFLGR